MTASQLNRVVLVVCEGLGVGASADAHRYGDEGADSLSNLSVQLGGLTLPFLQSYGLGHLTTILGVPPVAAPLGAYGKMRRTSAENESRAAYDEMLGSVVGALADGGHAVVTVEARDNGAALAETRVALSAVEHGPIFTRLPDLPKLPDGDAAGYYRALQAVDAFLPRLVEKLGPADLLVLTSDGGCDPTQSGRESGSKLTREDVPLLCIGQRPGDLGLRLGFADIAQTLCDAFGLHPWPRGESLLPRLLARRSVA